MSVRTRFAHVLLRSCLLVLLAGLVVVAVRHDPPPRPPAPPPGVPAAVDRPQMLRTPAPAPASPLPEASQQAAAPAPAPTATGLSTSWGIDVSWPQCRASLPRVAAGFVTVGVNDGKPFTTNPCLAAEVAFARSRTGVSAYLNLDAPRSGDPAGYGRRAALDGLARARAAGLRTPVLWLDVETVNHWSPDPAVNLAVIRAAVAALRARHVAAGVYSAPPMWQRITGDADPATPVWVATNVTDYRTLGPWCAAGLGGRAAVQAQYVATTGTQLVDVDVLCADALPDSVRLFSPGRA